MNSYESVEVVRPGKGGRKRQACGDGRSDGA